MKPVFFHIFIVSAFMLFLLPSVFSAEIKSYTAVYDVVLDKAVVDVIINYNSFHSQAEWLLPKDASAIEVSGTEFEVQPAEKGQKIIIKGPLFNQIKIKYITGSVIEKTKERFFILDLSSVDAESFSITVKLPEEANLKYTLDAPQPSVIPKTDNIKTDGQRIIIHWDSEDLQKAKSLLVIYAFPQELNLVFLSIIIVGVLIFAGAGLFFYYRRKKQTKARKKDSSGTDFRPVEESLSTSSDFTKNLFEEEKKIIEILLEAKDSELWQKELAHKSGLSKVKLSRKIRSLEQKGLIEKIPYGNTNKIRVKKG